MFGSSLGSSGTPSLSKTDALLHQSSTTIDAVQAMLSGPSQRKKVGLLDSWRAMFDDLEYEEEGYPKLHKAAITNDIGLFDHLVHLEEDIDVNARTDGGLRWTPLHAAAAAGSGDVVRSLVHKGARLNDGDANGWTPLHLAADRGDDVIVEELVSSGAMLHIKTSSGSTPLHLAAKKGHRKCIDILMKYGAELEVTNNIGQTPRAVAEQFRSKSYDPQYKPPLQETTAILDGLEIRRGVQRNKELAEFRTSFRTLRRSKRANSVRKRSQTPDMGARKRTGASGITIEEQLRRWEAYRTDKQQILRESLRSMMCGQDVAVRFASEATRRREACQRAEDFPLVMLFVGGAGTGKKTVALELANHTYADVENNYLEVDMTIFLRKEAAMNFNDTFVNLLGYGDIDDGRRRHFHGVIVLKNVDKADVDVFRALCDIFTTGLVSDSGGYPLVEVSNCIIIMTMTEVGTGVVKRVYESHPSSSALATHPGSQSDLVAQIKANIGDELDVALGKYAQDVRKKVTDIIPFVPLKESEIVGAADLHLKWKATELRKVKITLTWASQVPQFLARHYDESIGCESIRHAIFTYITERIIDAQDLGKINPGDSIRCMLRGDEVVIRVTYHLKGLPKELNTAHSFYI